MELLGGEAKAEPKEPRNEEELNPQKLNGARNLKLEPLASG